MFPVDGLYHSYLIIPSDSYKAQVMAGWLSLIINAGEGIDVDLFFLKEPKERVQQKIGQQIRINRSKIKDTSDTNSDFDDLDNAIRSGYFLKRGIANNEDFYYMSILITITAASCYPFASFEMSDDNGILMGVNKHNNSLVIVDIFNLRLYKNANMAILGTSGAGKTYTMQLMALRMRMKGIQVFIIPHQNNPKANSDNPSDYRSFPFGLTSPL